MAGPRAVSDFRYVGGDVALDFGNTLGDRGTERPNERLRTYTDLVWWAYGAGLLGGREARALLAGAQRGPAAAGQVLERAIKLREAVHSALAAGAAGTRPNAAVLKTLNDELAAAYQNLEVRPGGECCTLRFAPSDESLDSLLWPVARSAAELLTSPRVRQVKQCASGTCDWLFLDESRNKSRRWCDMAECGNRAKARRHYARKKKGHG